jgi:hypothetical protein
MVGKNTLEKTRNASEILVAMLEEMRSFGRIAMDEDNIKIVFKRSAVEVCT